MTAAADAEGVKRECCQSVSAVRLMDEREKGILGLEREKGMLARKTPCCARLRSNPSGSMLARSHQAHKVPIACASRTALYAAPSPPRGLGSDHIIILKTKKTLCCVFFVFRAGKGTRTLDPDLGKVVLYQLSYSREVRPIIEY